MRSTPLNANRTWGLFAAPSAASDHQHRQTPMCKRKRKRKKGLGFLGSLGGVSILLCGSGLVIVGQLASGLLCSSGLVMVGQQASSVAVGWSWWGSWHPLWTSGLVMGSWHPLCQWVGLGGVAGILLCSSGLVMVGQLTSSSVPVGWSWWGSWHPPLRQWVGHGGAAGIPCAPVGWSWWGS